MTDRLTRVVEENADDTLVTAEVGLAVGHVVAITKAAESVDTFTRPAPLTATAISELETGITAGDRLVTETTLKATASAYGDVAVQRTHSR